MLEPIRQSGILLHPTALPGKYGIGELGKEAYRFIDILADMNQSLWQVLPMGPTDSTFSPYSSSSAFAGNPYLISTDFLIEDGLVRRSDIKPYKFINKQIDVNNIDSFKMKLLFLASNSLLKDKDSALFNNFLNFCKKNSFWLDDYSRYCTLKIANNNKSWNQWKKTEVKNNNLKSSIKVIQFLFDLHWKRIKKYANNKGIQIVGDMPIYVSYDSSDVWSNRKLFQLDDNGKMIFEAGCPPCSYNENGQHWGMPLYSWNHHIDTNYEWWKKRFKKMFDLFDILRLDHFIGFKRYYSIPSDKKPKDGFWSDSPGDELIQSLSINKKKYDIFVEDLGDITEDVFSLRDKYRLSGTRVLQFDIDENTSRLHYPKNTVLYSGTHDNDTLVGWIKSLNEKKEKINFFNQFSTDNLYWDLIEYAMNSNCTRVIIPIQDILGLSSKHRFNTPGILSDNNWVWRFRLEVLSQNIIKKMKKITNNTNRTNEKIRN